MRYLKRYVAREVYKTITALSRYSATPVTVSAPTALAA
jgi:hypothetical protein